MKEIKKKYSLFSNIRFMLTMLWKSYRTAVFFSFIAIFTGVAAPYLTLLLPKVVVDALEAGVTAESFVLTVGGTALLLAFFRCLNQVAEDKVGYSMNAVLGFAALEYLAEKELDMDYELSEQPEVCKLQAQAEEMSWGANEDGTCLIKSMSRSAMNLLGLVVYGSVIMTVHPLIAFLLCIGVMINIAMLKWARDYEEKHREELNIAFHKYRYVSHFFANVKAGKDIRMYSMFDWLKSAANVYLGDGLRIYGSVVRRERLVLLAEGLVVLVRDGAAYAYLTYLVLQNRISIGEFLLVFSAMGSFAGWISELINSVGTLFRGSSQVSNFQAFCNLSDQMNRGEGDPLPTNRPFGFSFENVSYTYPEAEKPVLQNINLQIKPGEKIAVVGMNGAGKSTFIKLLCGLYQPTKGRVCADGKVVKEFNRDEYYTLFSVVFQDIHLITDTIAGNVSQQHPDATDLDKVKKCLQISGLYEKVESMPHKEKTLLVKSVNKEAVELSGGEMQKLALARALYKDAPVIVLDEPTAALDPIAESEIYQNYADLTKGRTSVFISHRLASTRFCDRILLIEEGTIIEEGTHEQLMAQKGRYAEMFEIQSSYYQDRAGEVSYG